MTRTVVLELTREDPHVDGVRDLLAAHVAFARSVTPRGHVHAMDVAGLTGPDVTVYAARVDGDLVGVAALRDLGPGHAELKSMHVRADVRGRGTGTALVAALVVEARRRGLDRLSLETGTGEAFAPARAVYAAAGFVPCPPFGDHTLVDVSTCMTLELDARARPATDPEGGGA